MDHDLGGVHLINWQGRRNRPIKPRLGAAALNAMLIVCALLGAALLAAQASGSLHWTGVMAAMPAAVTLLAISPRLAAMARGALGWLAA